jgi:plasmid stabilization system protein ParE
VRLGYEFHPLASRELEASADLLESERLGIGLEFAAAVDHAISQVRDHPESAPVARGSVRSKLILPSGRWPYTIYYRVTGDRIRVLAVGHQKRQPFYWVSRR